MANGWTPERRAKQAELIKTWKPWERSTGPRSEEGKAVASRNGWQGGNRQMLREISRALARQRRSLFREALIDPPDRPKPGADSSEANGAKTNGGRRP